MDTNKESTNTNASASLAGWDFQINAAIVLFMLNLKETKAIRVEGGIEDIEITLNDDTKIYSQSKHVADLYNYSTVREHLANALRTLNTASSGSDVSQLIYVTNSHNPFSDQRTISFFTGRTELTFEELPPICKRKVYDLIAKNHYDTLDLNKLSVLVIPFYGIKESNKYKEIKRAVEEVLADLNVNSAAVISKILHIWQRDFFQNATKTIVTINLSKKNLLWALIVILMEKADSITYKMNCNEGDLEFVKSRYSELINYQTLNFELITKVLADYNKNKIMLSRFIEENWRHYLYVVESLGDDSAEIHAILVKLILYKILTQRKAINEIKVEVGL